MPTPMPTAARLFAALAFAAVGFLGAEVLKPAFPEPVGFGWFSPIMAAIGLLCGWLVMGPNAGQGAVRAAGTGLRTSVTMVFWGMLLFALREMVLRSTARRYDGITEALVGTFGILIEQGRILLSSPETLIVLAGGGVLGGLLANWAAARFS